MRAALVCGAPLQPHSTFTPAVIDTAYKSIALPAKMMETLIAHLPFPCEGVAVFWVVMLQALRCCAIEQISTTQERWPPPLRTILCVMTQR